MCIPFPGCALPRMLFFNVLCLIIFSQHCIFREFFLSCHCHALTTLLQNALSHLSFYSDSVYYHAVSLNLINLYSLRWKKLPEAKLAPSRQCITSISKTHNLYLAYKDSISCRCRIKFTFLPAPIIFFQCHVFGSAMLRLCGFIFSSPRRSLRRRPDLI